MAVRARGGIIFPARASLVRSTENVGVDGELAVVLRDTKLLLLMSKVGARVCVCACSENTQRTCTYL